MKKITSISDLPSVPAVYAIYGGTGRRAYPAYVGMGGKLSQRIIQHMVSRDSSVATGTSAVGLNPEYVTRIDWWQHPSFAARDKLEAAELIAFEFLEPVLRSRGGITDRAKKLAASEEFRSEMKNLFEKPTGRLILPTLYDALERIAELEKRVAALERK